MSSFRQDDRELYYDVQGSADYPPLLLLHGSTASSSVFSALAPMLLERHRLILVDLLGHGRSSRFKSPPRHPWETNARIVTSLLETLDPGRVDILGVSGGAVVALNMALMAPDLVRRLALDSFFGGHIAPGEAASLAAGREHAMGAKEVAEFWKSLHGNDWREVITMDSVALLEAARRRLPLYVSDPRRIAAPVLLSASAEDELIPSAPQRLGDFAAQLQRAETLFFDSGGHPAMFSNPRAYLKALRDFLEAP